MPVLVKGMLLRQGSGKIKHLSTKQLWAQGAIQIYGISVEQILRAVNAADALTHSSTLKEMATHVKSLGFSRPLSWKICCELCRIQKDFSRRPR